jgi:uncharacterized protein (TIGR03437 family)
MHVKPCLHPARLNEACRRVASDPIQRMKFNQWFLFKAVAAGILSMCSAGPVLAQVYVTTTAAGNGSPGFTGDTGPAKNAELSSPAGLAMDGAGTLYIADEVNHRIRQVIASTQIINTVAGNGTAGYSGDGAVGTSAELNSPLGVIVDSSGNFYIADSINQVIRKVTPSDQISTVAGNNALGAGFSGDTSAPLNAQLNNPSAVALDSAGNLYIADTANNRVRKVSFSANTITTYAGSGGTTFSGDGLPAVDASLNAPRGLAFDAAGNLYIADSGNHAIRMVSATTHTMSTVAGTGTLGYNGDNIPATSAQLNYPLGVTLDSAGNMYIADSQNFRIRKVVNGVMTTIGGTGQPGYGGDGLYSTQSLFTFPASVLVDSTGKVYVGDSGNNVVRLLTPYATLLAPPLINPNGVVSASAFGQLGSVAPGSWIEIYGANLAADSRSWNSSDFQGINAPTSLDGTTVTIGGQPAYIAFIGNQQLNVQVPTDIATGPQRIIVYTGAGQSSPIPPVAVEPLQPGLYAPSTSNIGGNQYVWAQLSDGSIVLPSGVSSNSPSRPAKVGETMVMYGVGFGPVSPFIPAGQIVQQSNALAEKFHIQFGGVPASVSYAGLAPGAVGLYQFNVVVPNVGSGSAIPLTFTVANYTGQQTLYTAVQ